MKNQIQISIAVLVSTAIGIATSVVAHAGDSRTLYPVGFQEIEFEASHHEMPVSGAVWFPTGPDAGNITLIADNPVFEGTEVHTNAPATPGEFPVILLSHGLGGHWGTLAWLGAAMAENGAIVIAVNHPNSTTRDFDILKGLIHGSRVSDLQQALTYVSDDLQFSNFIDVERLYATGFSYGGWTALSMAGVRGSLSGYDEHCQLVGDASTHCNDIAASGIELGALDDTLWDASYKDERIQAVAAIDPGLLYGLNDTAVQSVTASVTLIGLGNENQRLLATDFSDAGNGFYSLLESSPSGSNATAVTIEPANHHSALRLCKPAGAAILKDENDDPVCDDPEGADRTEIHNEIVSTIVKAFAL